MLWRLTWLCDAALAAMREHTAVFSSDNSQGYLSKKFFNHCEHCGAKQREPGSSGGHVFQPDDFEGAQRITLHYYNRPLEASCHYEDTCIVGFFHLMKRAPVAGGAEAEMLPYLVEETANGQS